MKAFAHQDAKRFRFHSKRFLEDKKMMQKIRYNFLFVLGLVLIFGTVSTAFSQKKNRIPKNMGRLSVKSSPDAYEVRIKDGEILGESGVGDYAEFDLRPGDYDIEVEAPNGQIFSKRIKIVKKQNYCICLTFKEGITEECPYNVVVDPPEDVIEGEPAVFTARNIGINPTFPIRYNWRVSGGTILSGQGTPSISVSTVGMGDQTIRAFLDVTDDIPGSTCQQKNEVSVNVTKKPREPESRKCAEFVSRTPDENKANFDNCVIQANAEPNSQIYVILYRGTSKGSTSVERLKRQTLDYFVKTRGFDPRQIVVNEGGTAERTTVVIWIVPPGAPTPSFLR
jgi:hypothetical protein